MAVPSYQHTDFLQAFLACLPQGLLWDKHLDSNMARAIDALIPQFDRFNVLATGLLSEGYVGSVTALLPEWELSLGLPDPCIGTEPTVELRRNEVVARLTQRIAPNIPSLVQYAQTLGYNVFINEFQPFYADQGQADFPLMQQDAAYLWQVVIPFSTNLSFFSADMSAAGDGLWDYVSTVLQCEFARLKPAHTTVIFAFTEGAPIGKFSIAISSIH